MNKQETKEKIKVMQAFVDGKAIQYWDSFSNKWVDMEDEPIWNWRTSEFRIKPETKIRPYKDAAEFVAAQKEHGPYISSSKQYIYPIFIDREKGIVYGDVYGNSFESFEKLMKTRIWQDGSPCGIVVEEL